MSSTASTSRSTWQTLWDEAQPTLEDIQQTYAQRNSPAPRISRVGKLDAELLDQELVQVLQEPLLKALNLINVRRPLYCDAHEYSTDIPYVAYTQSPL